MGTVADVEVTEQVRADPAEVYAMVSDVTRMGSWSPETTSCQWLGDATGPAVGARFRGTNRHGPLLRWTTTCTVTDAEPGRRFAFDVDYAGVPISRWSYDFAATSDGCTVTESWTDLRPVVLRVAAVPIMGVADRGKHNRRGMRTTLAALRATAEG